MEYKLTKRKKFKEPKPKDNHNELFYDVDKMPFAKLFKMFETGYILPEKFKKNNFKIKVTEDSEHGWTENHGWDANLESDLWKHFGHLKFENNNVMKILGSLTMFSDYIKPGDDYVIMTNKERAWGSDKEFIYLGTKNVKTSLIIAYIVGGAAMPGCFLSGLSRNSVFRMQFTNPNGNFAELNIRWESKEWYENLKDVLKEWIKKAKVTTHGFLRVELFRRRFYNDQQCQKNGENLKSSFQVRL